jgi:AcrR family transcriptional regulator
MSEDSLNIVGIVMTTPGRRRAPAMSPDERRDMIIRAALPLVADHGAAVTTSQVARAAGIAEGTVFRAFADKNELIAACVAQALRTDDLVAELAAIPLDQPLAQRLTDAADTLKAHLERIGAVIGALHASGHPMHRPHPGERPHTGGEPAAAQGSEAAQRREPWLDRQRSWRRTRDAVVDLFEPDRETLRLPPERLADVFLRLMFTPRRAGWAGESEQSDSAVVVDLFLHGALAGER